MPATNSSPSDRSEAQTSSTRGEFGRNLKQELAKAHPNQGEWDIEKFHERAKQQLDAVGRWVFLDDGTPNELFTASATLPALEKLKFVTERDALGVLVRRAPGEPPGEAVTPKQFRAAIQQEMGSVIVPHFKMKVFRVTMRDAQMAATQVLVTASGLRPDGNRAQINSEWEVDWTSAGSEAPAIAKIVLRHWETVLVAEADGPWFQDGAGTVLANDDATSSARRQLGAGLPYWARRLDRSLQIEPTGYNGLALGDVNNDGLEDLYVCQSGGLPNRLLMQRNDGTVHDRSRDAGVDFLDNTRAALIVR